MGDGEEMDKADVEDALSLLNIKQLRQVVKDKDSKFKSREASEIRDTLSSMKWTKEEYGQLLDRIAKVEKEKSPVGFYIGEIDSIDQWADKPIVEQLEERFKQDQVSFNGQDEMLEEGFEILSSDLDKIRAAYWTENVSTVFTPRRSVRVNRTLYKTSFEISVNDRRLFIKTSNFGKAESLISTLNKKGVHIAGVDFSQLTNSRTNDTMQSFVDDFQKSVDDSADDSQQSVEEF